MAKEFNKQNKEGLAVSLGRLVSGFAQGMGRLLGLAAEMEKQGKSDYIEQGEIKGKTKSGKEYQGAYGFRVRVGLNKIQNAKN